MTVSKITSAISDNEEIDKINEIIDNLGGGGGGSLPPQTGHAGEFLTTNGTDASWAKTPTGRNVGELVYSAMPLTDAGLHLLDGTLLSGDGIYEEFVQYVAGLVSDYPSLFTSESTWQSTVSSKGVCGKFVYTASKQWYKWYCARYGNYLYTESLSPQPHDPIYYYNDASNWGVAFYVQYFQEGAGYDTLYGDNGSVSMTRAHGDTTIDLDIPSTIRLPKITGIIEGTTSVSALGDLVAAGLPNITGTVGDTIETKLDPTTTGAFYLTTTSSGGEGNGGYRYFGMGFDASLSNSIYGNSSTVQPQTIKQLVYMVIANSTKTEIEVDIDQIATDLNGKADVDLANLSGTGTTKIAHQVFPAIGFSSLTLGSSGTKYNASYDGYYVLQGKPTATSGFNVTMRITGNNFGICQAGESVSTSRTYYLFLPVRKGATVNISYSNFSSTTFGFVKAYGVS